ncbi:MAG TPA: hypothetical protein VMB79_00605 [Jatrophihabitans sp.]|nr:hypothetical protein [Jatrophihabitans sp.]
MPCRLRAVLAVAGLISSALVGVAATAPPAAAWPSQQLTLTGHGQGSGIGLGVDGAYGYATRYGWDATEIVDHYYGGSVRTVGLAPVAVDLIPSGVSWLRVTSPGAAFRIDNVTVPAGYSAKLTRTSSGYAVQVAAGGCAGRYGTPRAVRSNVFSSTVSAPTSLNQLLQLCGSGVFYRGSLMMVPGRIARDSQPYRAVNRLAMDDYLRSAIPGQLAFDDRSRFTATNSQAWLQALAIALRSLVAKSRVYQWANVTADQNLVTGNGSFAPYAGAGTAGFPSDEPHVVIAVHDTSSRLVVDSRGAVVRAVVSRSSGGWTAGGGFPVVQDLGDVVSPSHDWQEAVPVDGVSRALGGSYGTLQRITFTRTGIGDDGGRVVSITLVGDHGSLTVSGARFRDVLALKSNWFAVSTVPPSVHLSNELYQPTVDLGETFGRPGDQPVACDFDGDGTDTVGVYRASTGTFYIRNSVSSTAPYYQVTLGTTGDIPVCGDWNGDHVDTVGVYDPRTSRFYLINSVTRTARTPLVQVQFGGAGMQPVAGDWDGDGKDTLGVWSQSTHYFYLVNSLAPGAARGKYWVGSPGGTPIAGNWGTGGRDCYGFWEGTDLYLMTTPGGGEQERSDFGVPGSVPVVGDWNGDGSDSIGYGTNY